MSIHELLSFFLLMVFPLLSALQWRHDERYGVSNLQPHDCLLNHLFRRRSKKTSKLRVTALCEGNSPVTGEFPAQRASDAEKIPFDDVIEWFRGMESNSLYIQIHCACRHMIASSPVSYCMWLLTISRRSSGLTLAQVMDWCLMASSN